MKELIKSLQKTIDSSVQASRNPASSNKGPMLADYPSGGETSMEDDLESIFSSLFSTTASPAASFLSPTEENFNPANSAPPTTTVGASLYPSHGYLPQPSSHLQLSQEQRFSFPHTQQFSGPLSCSPSTTHMPAFGQLIRDTPAQKLTHPTPVCSAIVSAADSQTAAFLTIIFPFAYRSSDYRRTLRQECFSLASHESTFH